MNRISRKKAIALIGVPASLILTRAVWAQTTYEWTGNGLDTLWTDSANWSPISGAGTTFPVSGDSVLFNTVAADGSNIVNLGGAAQALTNMSFTNGAASYTVGILNSGDTLNFDAGGQIYASSNLANTQTINANINTPSSGSMTITTGDVGTLAFGGNMNLGGLLSISGASNGAIVTISGVISGTGSINLDRTTNFSGTNSVGLSQLNLLGHNTFSGGSILSAQNTIIPITYTPTDGTYGVFGTGTITFNSSSNQRLEPTGNSQIIYNAITAQTGFSMQAPGAASTNNLTMAGPITFAANGRYLSNGVQDSEATNYGGNFYLGLATSPSTITLPDATNQTSHFVGIAGPLIIYDVVQNSGTFVGKIQINDQAQDTQPVILYGPNTYSGNTTLGGNTAGMGFVGVGIRAWAAPAL